MRVLLTGGAGYIGSHTALTLLERGHEVVVFDDLSNGSEVALARVEKLSGHRIEMIEGDLTDIDQARTHFGALNFDGVIHFAGLKAVNESLVTPLRYYRTNLLSTINLLELMHEFEVNKLIFSSSATVYGKPQMARIPESHPVGIDLTNPYGWSKAMNEQIIRDTAAARPELEVVNLRYFNPVGAHFSGEIGEDPHGVPNNLMPYIAQVAVGRREKLSIFGGDYDTPDGTGVRDFIHVMDLAEGHASALEHAEPGVKSFNLGSGVGTSVLEAVRMFETVTGKAIPYEISPRRDGDLAIVIADPQHAKSELKWTVRRTFEDSCRDAWAWQLQNPNGYRLSGS